MIPAVDVVVGVVVKAHGVRGSVVVESHTDVPSRFAPGSALVGDHRLMTIRSARPQGSRLIVEFDQVNTREEAEALAGASLSASVPADERPVDVAEFFDRHLVGLTAELQDGTKIGQVIDVTHGVAQDILVIKTSGGERLVPFVEALVPDIDLAAGRITVADVPGLLSDEE